MNETMKKLFSFLTYSTFKFLDKIVTTIQMKQMIQKISLLRISFYRKHDKVSELSWRKITSMYYYPILKVPVILNTRQKVYQALFSKTSGFEWKFNILTIEKLSVVIPGLIHPCLKWVKAIATDIRYFARRKRKISKEKFGLI